MILNSSAENTSNLLIDVVNSVERIYTYDFKEIWWQKTLQCYI